ncbi:VOC family protein [Roseiarcaceae bacterium H3SJ34-1]|uniref:VOC family protein n=1 Tax=Terripilifer ovatus TaxID=3032367 RepID=UPI003AB93567|nr:VOC family protein [Roseiarcaceae bacterium H3SJ34-1]
MIQVKRLGHGTFATPDLEQQVDYWTNVIGLQVIERGRDKVFLATKLGQEAIALERGPEPVMSRIAFQVAPGSDLGEIAAKLQTLGVASEKRSGISPGVDEAVVFTDPKGTQVEVYAEYRFYKQDMSDTGIGPFKFGHVAHRVENVQKTVDFYTDVLGFRTSDWMGDHFAFMRCGVDHHTVNFVRYDTPALHHIAFEVKDWSELHRACEVLAKHKIHLVWGPLRHVVGHNVAAYHRNADGVRVEMFCEMDLMKDEELGYWEPRPWHEEMPLRPKRWPKDTLRSAWGFGSFGTFPGYP